MGRIVRLDVHQIIDCPPKYMSHKYAVSDDSARRDAQLIRKTMIGVNFQGNPPIAHELPEVKRLDSRYFAELALQLNARQALEMIKCRTHNTPPAASG
jgi:hypothetical protein